MVEVVSSKLGARRSQWLRFAGYLISGLAWTTVLVVYLGKSTWERRSDEGSRTVLALMLLPGLGLLVAAWWRGLALFNPTYEVHVSEGLALGSPFQFQWRLVGRRQQDVKRLVVRLEGLEEVHLHGAEKRLEQHVFFSEIVVDAKGPDVREGETRIDVPRGLLPSFAGKNHRVIWRLSIDGTIAVWPNIVDEFTLEVRSRKRRAA